MENFWVAAAAATVVWERERDGEWKGGTGSSEWVGLYVCSRASVCAQASARRPRASVREREQDIEEQKRGEERWKRTRRERERGTEGGENWNPE